jgi:hypothetical protein
MNMTVILFQIDFDRFSALAIDLDRPKRIWKVTYESLQDLIRSLERAGAVTTEEIKKLWDETCFSTGGPILRVAVNQEDIESAGFVRVLPVRPNDSQTQPHQV